MCVLLFVLILYAAKEMRCLQRAPILSQTRVLHSQQCGQRQALPKSSMGWVLLCSERFVSCCLFLSRSAAKRMRCSQRAPITSQNCVVHFQQWGQTHALSKSGVGKIMLCSERFDSFLCVLTCSAAKTMRCLQRTLITSQT